MIEPITGEKIDELLEFLPIFDTAAQTGGIERWAGGQKLSNGAVTMPYPVYSEESDSPLGDDTENENFVGQALACPRGDGQTKVRPTTLIFKGGHKALNYSPTA
jgi:hypothetical protein